jgi:heme/copper-type cytochrome/quinol oxidase subunit 2
VATAAGTGIGPATGRGMMRLPAALFGAAALAAAPLIAQGPREVVATGGGWRPPVLNVKKGEVVRLSLKTDDEERCFAIDELRIEKRIVPGRATSLEFTPDRAGNFAFYDCLNPEGKKGRLAVTD